MALTLSEIQAVTNDVCDRIPHDIYFSDNVLLWKLMGKGGFEANMVEPGETVDGGEYIRVILEYAAAHTGSYGAETTIAQSRKDIFNAARFRWSGYYASNAIDLNDRSWIIHTRTEEQPPVRLQRGSEVIDSLITDGCVIQVGARVEKSILSPGVRVEEGAVIRESVILTDTVIGRGAVIEHAIIDKKVRIGENSRVGKMVAGSEPTICMIGKNSVLPPGYTVEPGAVIGTDVCAEDYSSNIVRGDEYIQTKRLPYEV